MESAKGGEPQLTELMERLIAETEHLIEEGRLLAREIEITKEKLGALARVRLPKPARRRSSEADRKIKKAG
jgi:hypothetical protein